MTLTTANDTPAALMIIDDHPLLRRGVAQLLELEDDLELVGETGDAEEGIALALKLEPDLVLLDFCSTPIEQTRRVGLNLIHRSPGDTVQYNINGQLMNVVIPPNLKAGDTFEVSVPVAIPTVAAIPAAPPRLVPRHAR